MAASPQIAPVPVEVYLRTSYEPDAEYVDGVIEERPMGQNDHSAWQNALQVWRSTREGVGDSRPAGVARPGFENSIPRA
jgi:hypothetical protein